MTCTQSPPPACAGSLVADAVALGAETTVISRSPGKLDDARRLGAQSALIRARLALVSKGAVAIAEVTPDSGSERNYVRCGFDITYTRNQFSRALE